VHVANVLTQQSAGGSAGALPPELDRGYLTEIGMWDRAQSWRSLPGSGIVAARAA